MHVADDLGGLPYLVKIEQLRAGLERLAGELEQYAMVNGHRKTSFGIYTVSIIYHSEVTVKGRQGLCPWTPVRALP